MKDLDDKITKLLEKATSNSSKNKKTEKSNLHINRLIQINGNKINIISGGTLIIIALLVCYFFLAVIF